jgi:Nodulation protein Z (NodZ)
MERVLLTKGTQGMGNRIGSLLTAILYARLSARKLIVDWTDECYSTDGRNAIHDFFEGPFHPLHYEILEQESIAPVIWQNHIRESANSLRGRYGGNRADVWQKFSVDIRKLDHPETVAVLWTYSPQVDLLRPHLLGTEFEGQSTDAILRKLIREDLTLRPHVREKVRQFKRERFRGKTVGVHVRYTDYQTRLLAAVGKVNQLLKREPATQIFLATDNIQIKKLFEKLYSSVISTDHRYSYPGDRLHYGKGRQDPTSDGISALVDMYLLAECDELIVDTGSSFPSISVLLSNLPREHITDLRLHGRLPGKLEYMKWRAMLKSGFFTTGLDALGSLLSNGRQK